MGRMRLLVLAAGRTPARRSCERRDGLRPPRGDARTEQLRGLKTTHPLAVSTLDAAGMKRVVLRELARERQPRQDAAWNDALHLLGVLERGQSLEQVERRKLTGQVAGLYVPAERTAVRARLGRLAAALGDRARGHARAAGRALPPHARAVRPAPGRPRRRARGACADRGRCHERPVALRRDALARATSLGELARTLRLDPVRPGRGLGAVPPARAASTPTRRARSSCARCGSAAASACSTGPSATRRGRPPPCSIRRATWPAIRLRQAVGLPAGNYVFETTFGAEDLIALTGRTGSRARGWAGASGSVRAASTCAWRRARAASVAAALEHVLPAAAAVAFRGQLVCVRVARTKASGRAFSCR